MLVRLVFSLNSFIECLELVVLLRIQLAGFALKLEMKKKKKINAPI